MTSGRIHKTETSSLVSLQVWKNPRHFTKFLRPQVHSHVYIQTFSNVFFQ